MQVGSDKGRTITQQSPLIDRQVAVVDGQRQNRQTGGVNASLASLGGVLGGEVAVGFLNLKQFRCEMITRFSQ